MPDARQPPDLVVRSALWCTRSRVAGPAQAQDRWAAMRISPGRTCSNGDGRPPRFDQAEASAGAVGNQPSPGVCCRRSCGSMQSRIEASPSTAMRDPRGVGDVVGRLRCDRWPRSKAALGASRVASTHESHSGSAMRSHLQFGHADPGWFGEAEPPWLGHAHLLTRSSSSQIRSRCQLRAATLIREERRAACGAAGPLPRNGSVGSKGQPLELYGKTPAKGEGAG